MKRRVVLMLAVCLLLLVGVVYTADRAEAAPVAFVQQASGVTRSGSSVAVTLPNVTAGNLVVAYTMWDSVGSASATASTGDRFSPVSSRVAWRSDHSAKIMFTVARTSGPLTVRIAYGTPITRRGQLFVSEYSGVDPVNPLEAQASSSGSGPVMSAGPVTSTGGLLYAAGASSGDVGAVGAGFTARSRAFANLTADAIVGPGSWSVTATQNSSAWVFQLVAFRAVDPNSTPTTLPPTTQPPATTVPPTTLPPHHGHDECMFTSFCDNFMERHPGGRAGDLDESRWSAARTSQATNPGSGLVNNYAPFDPEFCTDHDAPPRLPDDDSFICGEEFGEPNHWMEGMDDQDGYVNNSFRVVQPFDFAGRTGTLDFSVDARSVGNHSAWPEIWLTEDPVQAPHGDYPGTHVFPRRGVGFVFNADWCGTSGNAIRQILTYNEHVESVSWFPYSPCFSTQNDVANHIQLKVSGSRVEVWASDAGGANFRLRGAANVTVPFSRGYWSLQHAQYAADKFNGMNPTTYHWHAVSFDGPVLPVDGSYQVPDALVMRSDGRVNLGYQTPTSTFTLEGVGLAGASRAWVTFNVYWYSSPATLNVTLNGVSRPASDPNPDVEGHRYQWRQVTLPVPLEDLREGSNTVRIANTGCSFACPTVANIDLEVVRMQGDAE